MVDRADARPLPEPGLPAGYPVAVEHIPAEPVEAGRYRLDFARSREQLDRILRLRYRVFNLELEEGLESSHETGLDEDELDWRFHHLMISERATGQVVGTYRLQTVEMARKLGGFYTEGEFDLSGFGAPYLDRSVEIGRACVAKAHRNGRVLHLLWRGLAQYLAWNRKTILFGCCSLTSQDEALGVSTLHLLEREGHMHPDLHIDPLPATRCSANGALPEPHVPALFRSYLDLGAKVCGPPAIDRLFQTIDFLVVLDTATLPPRVFRSFFR